MVRLETRLADQEGMSTQLAVCVNDNKEYLNFMAGHVQAAEVRSFTLKKFTAESKARLRAMLKSANMRRLGNRSLNRWKL